MCYSLEIYVLFSGNIHVILWKYLCYSLEIYVLFPGNICVIPWKYVCFSLEHLSVLFIISRLCSKRKTQVVFLPETSQLSPLSPPKQGKDYEIGLLQKQNELIAG